MSVTAKTLIPARFAQNVANVEYLAPANTRTIIDKFTATNTDSAAATLSVHLVPSGQSAQDSNQVIRAQSITAGQTFDFTALQNQILSTGDSIVVLSGTALKVSIRASGREVT